MTIPIEDRVTSYTASGGERIFDFEWPVGSAAELDVGLVRDGVSSTLIFETDFLINGFGNPQGGEIVLVEPALRGDVYTLDSSGVLDGGQTGGVPTVYVLARWRRAWATDVAYSRGDGVREGGSTYVCLLPHTSSAATRPGLGAGWTTFWDLVASVGSQGIQGPPGGVTPEIAAIIAGAASPAPLFEQVYLDWIDAPSLTGVLAEGFTAGVVGRFDGANVLAVTLSSGTLETVTMQELLAGTVNMCAVKNAGGDWEVLQFLTAELQSGTTYHCSMLLRGLGGTEGNMGSPTVGSGAEVRVR